MDLYTAERIQLERHEEMIRDAERRARLLPRGRRRHVRLWVAGRLRTVADRIDGGPRLQRVV
jgi:hypothetical protein